MGDNLYMSTKKLLDLQRIKNTKRYIEDSLLSHADYPSILSVADTLHKYKIDNLTLKVTFEKLKDLPLPSLVQVTVNDKPLFYVLSDFSKGTLSCYDEKNKKIQFSKENFLKIWTGICLVAETSKNSKEPDIEKKHRSVRMVNILKILLIVFLAAWLLSSLLKSSNPQYISVILLTLLKIFGLVTTVLLLWFEIDKYNPSLQSFCSGGNKINCNKVLESKYASLFNGAISLSSIGFSYFFGSLLYLLITSFSASSLTVTSIFSFMALPVVAISIYYQAAVIKQWCKFCIGIQLVLVGEIVLSYLAGFYSYNIAVDSFPILGTLFVLSILVWMLIKPLLENQRVVNFYKRSHKKIKNNPKVLEGLLSKSRKLETSVEGLGISLKQQNAKYDIIKVCNPYCGPCSSAHPILEELLEQGKINLQILFTARADDDRSGKPVRHFMALYEKNKDRTKIQKALDDWYLAEKKDYGTFAQKYPMNGELVAQSKRLEAMSKWCEKENITHTPTIFINGHELPDEYNVEDLLDVL